MPIDFQAISAAIGSGRSAIAGLVNERHAADHPEGGERSGQDAQQFTVEDTNFGLCYLAQAIALETPGLFEDYAGWLKVVLASRRVPPQEMLDHFQYLQEGLREVLAPGPAAVACEYVAQAARRFPNLPGELPGPNFGHAPGSLLAGPYLQALLRGDRRTASRLVLDAVAAGISVQEIYLGVFESAQHEIGRLWQTNRVSVAQEHFCTAATQLIMSQLYTHISPGETNGATLVATSVAGDLHEVGVRMVADFFEMDGWHAYYLGANTPHTDVIATLVGRRVDVLAVSATIPYHLDAVATLIRRVRAHPAGVGVKILAGGGAFQRDSALWRKIGADGSAVDAQQAVAVAHRLTGVEGRGIPVQSTRLATD